MACSDYFTTIDSNTLSIVIKGTLSIKSVYVSTSSSFIYLS